MQPMEVRFENNLTPLNRIEYCYDGTRLYTIACMFKIVWVLSINQSLTIVSTGVQAVKISIRCRIYQRAFLS